MATPIPTHAETKQLAALISPQETLPTSREQLSEILKYLQNPDVKNFLLTEDPIQLNHLMNPCFRQSIVAGSISATRVDGSPTNDLSDHIFGNFLLASAFTANHLSFGFGVHQHTYTPSQLWYSTEDGYPRWSESRFIRDDSQNSLLVLSDSAETEILEVDYSKLISPTCQIRVIARFHNTTFRELVHLGLLGADQLSIALHNIQVAFEFRKCPQCQRRPCSCVIPFELPKPRHAFDSEAFSSLMKARMGTFLGYGAVAIY